MLVKFGDQIVKFGDQLVSIGEAIPLITIWSFNSTSDTFVDDGMNWYTYSSGKITLAEDTETPTDYPCAVLTLANTIDITDAKFNLKCYGTSDPVLLMYLVDSDGNISNYINIGATTSGGLTLECFTADTSNHHSLGNNSSIRTLANADLTSYLGSCDPTKIQKIKFCIANWYQSSPTWKERSKALTITAMSFTK